MGASEVRPMLETLKSGLAVFRQFIVRTEVTTRTMSAYI